MTATRLYDQNNFTNTTVQQGDTHTTYNFNYTTHQHDFRYETRDYTATPGKAGPEFAARESPDVQPSRRAAGEGDHQRRKGYKQPKQPTSQPTAPTGQRIDWKAVLGKRCEARGYNNWLISIVDLLKGLDLPSELSPRSKLADVLGVRVAGDGELTQNTALHRAVMRELEVNNGELSPLLKEYKEITQVSSRY